MKNKTILPIIFPLALTILFSGYMFPDTSQPYSYVSLVEEGAFILQEGAAKPVKAVVNFPLMSGDTVYTADNGRCEIQFDNGTVMRLDKSSKFKINTLRAESLTTRWKITNLELISGRLYSMNNNYKREMFQVMTPHAAIKMANNSSTAISVEEDETHVHVDRGKVGVLYGDGKESLEKEFVRADKGFVVTSDHKITPDNKRRHAEFHMWNEYVNNNFKDLHYGISKVPKPIYRYPKAVIEFAEKWSNIYGEWIYNDLFGYIWKPYDSTFSDRRPFFHARYVWSKDDLYIVPLQAWGWAPAHLGTWHWMKKKGWVWIPGNAFSPGMFDLNWLWNMSTLYRQQFFTMMYQGWWWKEWHWHRSWNYYYRNTLDCWIDRIYGGYPGYITYRRRGAGTWSMEFKKGFQHAGNVKKPSFENVPVEVAAIIKKMNTMPLSEVGKYFDMNRHALSMADSHVQRIKTWLVYRNNIFFQQDNRVLKDLPVIKKDYKLDWNPDRVVARRLGVRMKYSSKTNEVVIPALKLRSSTITPKEKMHLRTLSTHRFGRGLSKSGLLRRMSGTIGSGTPGTSGLTSGNSSSAGRSAGSSAKSGGSGMGMAKEK